MGVKDKRAKSQVVHVGRSGLVHLLDVHPGKQGLGPVRSL